MTGEQVIIAVLLVIAIGGMFILADDWREIFSEAAEDIFGDVPRIPDGFGSEATRETRGGGPSVGAGGLMDGSHYHRGEDV